MKLRKILAYLDRTARSYCSAADTDGGRTSTLISARLHSIPVASLRPGEKDLEV
jgi:hypothetical protein